VVGDDHRLRRAGDLGADRARGRDGVPARAGQLGGLSGRPPFPFIYEINTWPWLTGLSAAAGARVDLGSVPGRTWDAIAEAGFDQVWLMGVWRRSPAGRAIALADPDLVASFDAALPGWGADDVVGSPYCIRAYVVDDHLGGAAGLAAARAALAERGVGLLLDFVPNHVSPDHAWTTQHPERFVRGTAEDLRQDPMSYVAVGGEVLANGRDPYFPAWPDVVQLDAFSPDLRAAVVETLRDIGDQCDGVRCDMAMLMMNDVFARTWGERVGPPPAEDYWPTVIPAVRSTHPDMTFVAEAYWDLEWVLQQQGFDHCYDKRLYDRLLHDDAEQVRLHLLADPAYQAKLLRFLENHDEPRIAAELAADRQRAATVLTLTQTGARLVHDGQAEGRKVRLPVFLGRFPDEPVDEELRSFHQALLRALADPTFRHGHWELCERSGWDGDDRYRHLVAWSWDGSSRWLIVVNLSDVTAAGLVRVPWPEAREQSWRLTDPVQETSYLRTGDGLADGLYVELGPWAWHLFRAEPVEDAA
jgi:hypothetical protein